MTESLKKPSKSIQAEAVKTGLSAISKDMLQLPPLEQLTIAPRLLGPIVELLSIVRDALAVARSAQPAGIDVTKKAKKKPAKLQKTEKLVLAGVLGRGVGRMPPEDAIRCLIAVAALDRLCGGLVSSSVESDSELSSSYASMAEEVLSGIDWLLMAGMITELQRVLADQSPLAEKLQKRLIEQLRRLAMNPDARMTSATREFLSTYAEKHTATNAVGLTTEGQSVRSRQLARALMNAWKGRESGPDGKGTFEAIRDYAAEFCGVGLVGALGDKVKFDRRIHFGAEISSGESVEVVRPGVQWSSAGAVEMLIPIHVQKAAA